MERENIKLIASGKVTEGEYRRNMGLRIFNMDAQHYQGICGDEYFSGYMLDGVNYQNGKQPVRLLSLIVPGEAPPFTMTFKYE